MQKTINLNGKTLTPSQTKAQVKATMKTLATPPVKKAPMTLTERRRIAKARVKAQALNLFRRMENEGLAIELDDEYQIDRPTAVWYALNPNEPLGDTVKVKTSVVLELLKHKDLVRRCLGLSPDGDARAPMLMHRNHPQIGEWEYEFVMFHDKKALTKAVVMKLKPGTWIEVKFMDSYNIIVLLLEEPECLTGKFSKGQVLLHTFDPVRGEANRRVYSDQVVRVAGYVMVPIALNAGKNDQRKPNLKPSVLNRLTNVVDKCTGVEVMPKAKTVDHKKEIHDAKNAVCRANTKVKATNKRVEALDKEIEDNERNIIDLRQRSAAARAVAKRGSKSQDVLTGWFGSSSEDTK